MIAPTSSDRHETAPRRASVAAGAWERTDSPRVARIGSSRAYMERFLVREGERLIVVRLDEVDWIEGDGNFVVVHSGGVAHRMRRTLDSLEALLDPVRFVRIHRSSIVNIDRVAELAPTLSGCYDVRLSDGARLVLSRTHRSHLFGMLGRI